MFKSRALDYRAAWVAAWRVDAGECDAKADGLLFRRACEQD